MKFSRYFVFSLVLAASQVSHAGFNINPAALSSVLIMLQRLFYTQPQAGGGAAATANPQQNNNLQAMAAARARQAFTSQQHAAQEEEIRARNAIEEERQRGFNILTRAFRMEAQAFEHQRQAAQQAQERLAEAEQGARNAIDREYTFAEITQQIHDVRLPIYQRTLRAIYRHLTRRSPENETLKRTLIEERF